MIVEAPVATPNAIRTLSGGSLKALHALLATLIVAIAAVSLATLDAIPFWLDEILTVLALDGDLTSLLRNRIQAGHQPLYFSLAWLWKNLFGLSEFSLRALSWAFLVATLALAWALARRTLGPTSAWVCAALTAASPHLFYFSHIARPYAASAPLVLLSLLAISEHVRRPRRVTLALVAGATLLLLLTHYSLMFVVGAQLAYALLRRRPHWSVVLTQLGVAAAWTPWALWCMSHYTLEERFHWLDGPDLANLFIAAANIVFDGPGVSRLHSAPLVIPLAWSAVSLAVVAMCVIGAQRMGETGRLVLFTWATPLLLAVASMLLFSRNLFPLPRYFVATIATSPLLIVAALRPWRGAPRWVGAGFAVAVAAVLALSTASLARHALKPTHRAPWREMAEYLSTNLCPGERVLALHYADAVPLAFYLGHDVDVIAIEGTPRPRSWIKPVHIVTPDELKDTPGLWIAMSEERQWKLARRSSRERKALDALSQAFQQQDEKRFPTGELLKLAP